MAGRIAQKSDEAGLQPSSNFVMRWQASTVHDLAVDNYGRRRMDTMLLYLSGVLTLAIATATPRSRATRSIMPIVTRHLLQPDPKTSICIFTASRHSSEAPCLAGGCPFLP